MLTTTIPSYVYEQYNDDQDIQAFNTAYNTLAQQYVNWFNQIGLPIYTGPLITGSLLDWVAEGIYGITRPYLAGAGMTNVFGEFNSSKFNSIQFNQRKVYSPSTYYQTNDDIFKRIITWNFYKGDGQVFNIRWLKRRVLRFLLGTNGTDPGISQTYQISVTFGSNNQVNINIKSHATSLKSGAQFNKNKFNTSKFNAYSVTTHNFTPLPNASILAAAIKSGTLNLPFQFTYIVNVT